MGQASLEMPQLDHRSRSAAANFEESAARGLKRNGGSGRSRRPGHVVMRAVGGGAGVSEPSV
jgi:hypothetical protein